MSSPDRSAAQGQDWKPYTFAKWRKKPVVIEAIQYRGQYDESVKAFLDGIPHEFDNAVGIKIATLEGVMTASQFDYLIRGVQGEVYPCKPDIFEETYERVE